MALGLTSRELARTFRRSGPLTSKALVAICTRDHSSTPSRSAVAAGTTALAQDFPTPPPKPSHAGHNLHILPLSSVLRTFVIMSVSSRPVLLKALTSVLERTVQPAPSLLFDVDRNHLLRAILYHTFYAQFCAGWTHQQVRQCAQTLRAMGYKGIVLEYARELLEEGGTVDAVDTEMEKKAVESWRQGIVKSIEMCREGDGVAFKWSGMGQAAFQRMKANETPSAVMKEAMESICDAAALQGVKLWPAAEPQNAQAACDAWTIDLMKKYNRLQQGTAVLFNTYQCYLKSTPETLSKHLAYAQEHHFTLGVKLVRGAYLHSEPRHLIWDTAEDTHACFDQVCEDLLWKRYGSKIRQVHKAAGYPDINMVIASHNQRSVNNVKRIQEEQSRQDRETVPLLFAQLYGMADEVSCGLLPQAEGASKHGGDASEAAIYKYVTWGTMRDSLNYLLRRAAENQDAFARTVETRDAMRSEIWHRAKRALGLH